MLNFNFNKMKRIIIILSLIAVLTSCSKDLEKLNVNIKDATAAGGETFFAYAEKEMAGAMSDLTYGSSGTPWTICRFFAQQISANTYNEGSNYFAQFNWTSVYMNVLKNLDESRRNIEAVSPLTDAATKQKQNQLAIIEVMNVYTYTRLVESFGNIPYKEALVIDNVLPKYEDQKAVYTDLISRLNAAIAKLDISGTSFGTSDLIYSGSVANWKSFANSMKLQMGMRIIEALPELGTTTVQAAIPGVFTSNTLNAKLTFLTAQPNTNPLWVDLAVGNRQDFVAAAPLVDQMNAVADPRRAVYFTTVSGAFVGAPYGLPVEYSRYSHFGDLFYTPTVPSILLDYATVEFLLAEAVERAIPGATGTAEQHYNAAITASFSYYGVSGIDTYLRLPQVAYQTATGPWKRKIGIQKWIALYNQGFEAWTEYRRLDYPELKAPVAAFINVVPKRLLYPTSEQTLNTANWSAASSAIGGDLMTTKLFWDIN